MAAKDRVKIIEQAKRDYEAAKKKGDKAAMAKAHADADKARGYATETVVNNGKLVQTKQGLTPKNVELAKANAPKPIPYAPKSNNHQASQLGKQMATQAAISGNAYVPAMGKKEIPVLGDMFDQSENYVDKFKKGDIGGGIANFVGTGLTGAQSLYLNTFNRIDSLRQGQGIPDTVPMMSYADYEKAVADRAGVKPISEKVSDFNPLLGGAYKIGMEIGTDPLELTPVGFLNDFKVAKGAAAGSDAYNMALQAGKLPGGTMGIPVNDNYNVNAPRPIPRAVQAPIVNTKPTTYSKPLKPIEKIEQVKRVVPTDPQTMEKLETETVKNIGQLLTGATNRDKKLIRKAVADFNTGKINADDLYGTLEEITRNIPYAKLGNKEVLDGVRDYVKSGIQLSDDLRQIPDFNDFRKANVGKIRFSPNGRPVETIYGELGEKYGNLFPEEITHPVEQLERIISVLDSNQPKTVRMGDALSGREIADNFIVPAFNEVEDLARLSKSTITDEIKTVANQTFKGKPQTIPQAPNRPVQPTKSVPQGNVPPPKPIPVNLKRAGPVAQKHKDLGADVNRFEEVAMVTTDSKSLKPTPLEKMAGITGELKRKFVDAGDTVAKIAKINGDNKLYAHYNNARNSRRRAEFHIGKAQTNLNGDTIGKSLKDIFKPIQDKGKNFYEDFQEYMYHLHNIDRMEQGKPVFGASITADESRQMADYLLGNNPSFINHAAEVRNYLDNMMQYRVDAGLVSDEGAEALAAMYKNYVPTYRVNPSAKGLNVSGRSAVISTGIKKAKGSSKDLLPLHEQISKQTMQTVEAAHKNIFGRELAKNINDNTRQFIQELKKIDDTIDIDADVLPELKNTFNIYEDGVSYQMKVDDTLYEGIKALTGKDPNALMDLATQGNKVFKELITSWSPMFLIRNFARDIQDVGLYSKNLKEFAKQYPKAAAEIATNGKMWQKYQALGGAGNSFFDYAQGYTKDPSWLRKNTVDRVESLNMATEQLPRFAEFMATLEKAGPNPTYDDLMVAMYNAADATVNFGRSGTWGKTINSTFVPFFNPAIQGTSKVIRRFKETKGVNGWTELVLKISALGMAPSLINEMIYHDDPEYANLQNRVKDTNYMFKIGDGEWIKIPKGRVLSMFGSPAQRVYRDIKGDEDAYAGLIVTAMDQNAPINPFESNIVAPIITAGFNKTWYGGDIEPQRVQDMKPSERYTEGTTELSKAIVGKMGKFADKHEISPMKLDYILDAYTGIVGDIAMPMLTPRAETNPMKKAFVTDSVTQNKISEDFYRAKDEIMYNHNSENGTLSDSTMNRYMNKVTAELTELNAAMREIEGGIGTDANKRARTREIRKQINEIQLNALSNLKKIQETSKSLSEKYDDLDVVTRETNREVFGAEKALQMYNKKVYEKAQANVKEGFTYDDFYDGYFAQLGQPTSIRKAVELQGIGNPEMYEVFDISKKSVTTAKALAEKGLVDAYDKTYPKLKGIESIPGKTESAQKRKIIKEMNPDLSMMEIALLYRAFNI